MEKVLVIVGPTAVGKTALSVELSLIHIYQIVAHKLRMLKKHNFIEKAKQVLFTY